MLNLCGGWQFFDHFRYPRILHLSYHNMSQIDVTKKLGPFEVVINSVYIWSWKLTYASCILSTLPELIIIQTRDLLSSLNLTHVKSFCFGPRRSFSKIFLYIFLKTCLLTMIYSALVLIESKLDPLLPPPFTKTAYSKGIGSQKAAIPLLKVI